MALPKRKPPNGAVPPVGGDWIDPTFTSDYPSVHAFLFDCKYENGDVRRTGGISLYTRLGVLTAAVNDNDRMLVAYVTALTWDELLFKLEDGICNDSLEWKGKAPFGGEQKGNSPQAPPY